jgi:hypothetical protein
MPIAGILAARSAVRAIVSVAVLLSVSPPACHATHNITAILSGYRDLSEFSRALTATGLADDIDGRNTITVLAVNDAHMAPLLKARRGLPREAQRRVLSLHVLADYYDAAKLRRLPGGSVDASTLFQASGDAPGSAGMVKISQRRGGHVAFAPPGRASRHRVLRQVRARDAVRHIGAAGKRHDPVLGRGVARVVTAQHQRVGHPVQERVRSLRRTRHDHGRRGRDVRRERQKRIHGVLPG